MTDYKSLVDQAVAALRAVMRVDAEKIRATVSYTHSVAPLINPTAYRAGIDSLEEQATVANAILAAQRAVLSSDRLTMLLTVADAQDGHDPWPCTTSREVGHAK